MGGDDDIVCDLEKRKRVSTKWDVVNHVRLTKLDFYDELNHRRHKFLIPIGVSYPNEASMLEKMNKFQKCLKKGFTGEWCITSLESGSRIVHFVKSSKKEDGGDPEKKRKTKTTTERKTCEGKVHRKLSTQPNLENSFSTSVESQENVVRHEKDIGEGAHDTPLKVCGLDVSMSNTIAPLSKPGKSPSKCYVRTSLMATNDTKKDVKKEDTRLSERMKEDLVREPKNKNETLNSRRESMNKAMGDFNRVSTKEIMKTFVVNLPEGMVKSVDEIDAKNVKKFAEIDRGNVFSTFRRVVSQDSSSQKFDCSSVGTLDWGGQVNESSDSVTDCLSVDLYSSSIEEEMSENWPFNLDQKHDQQSRSVHEEKDPKQKKSLADESEVTSSSGYITDPKTSFSSGVSVIRSLVSNDKAFEMKHEDERDVDAETRRRKSGSKTEDIRLLRCNLGDDLERSQNRGHILGAKQMKHKKTMIMLKEVLNESVLRLEGVEKSRMSIDEALERRRKRSENVENGIVDVIDRKNLRKSHENLTRREKIPVGSKSENVLFSRCSLNRSSVHITLPQVISTIVCSSAVNRKHRSRDIAIENTRLQTRLTEIKTKPTKNPMSFRQSHLEQLPFARIQHRKMNE